MFPCPRCKGKAEVADNLKSNGASQRRERECLSCHFTFTTTEVADSVYKAAVEKRAIELAKKKVAETFEILGIDSTGNKKRHG